MPDNFRYVGGVLRVSDISGYTRGAHIFWDTEAGGPTGVDILG